GRPMVTAPATRPLLNRKYDAPNTASGPMIRPIDKGWTASGCPWTAAKNRRAEVHIATAGAVTLKARRAGVAFDILSRHDWMKPSSVTSSAPDAGPKSSADRIEKVSPSEKLAGNPGSRTMAPLETAASPARTSHSVPGGREIVSTADDNKTTVPAAITVPRYTMRPSSLFVRRLSVVNGRGSSASRLTASNAVGDRSAIADSQTTCMCRTRQRE